MASLCQPSPSEPAKTPVTIDVLPDDVLEMIFRRLADKVDADGRDRQKELLPLERVCKRWRPFVLDVAWEIVAIRSPDGQPPNVMYPLAHPDILERVRIIDEDPKAILRRFTTRTDRLRPPAVLQLLARCTRLTRLSLAFVIPEDDLLPTICTAQNAKTLKRLTLVPMLRDASSLSRLLEHLAKLHNLITAGLKTGDWSDWSPSAMTIERPLRLRTLGLHIVSAGDGSPARIACALHALGSILDPETLEEILLGDWSGDAAAMDALAKFPNLRLLDVALHMPAPDVAQGLRAMHNLEHLRVLRFRRSLDQSELVVRSPFSLHDFLAALPPNLNGVPTHACRVFAFPADEAEELEILDIGTEGVMFRVLVYISVYEDENKLAKQEIKTKRIVSTTSLRNPTWRRLLM